MADDEQDKQHEPSQKKLDDARKKGDLPRSQDVNAAISYGTILITFVVMGPWIGSHFGDLGVSILGRIGHSSATRAHMGVPLDAASLLRELGTGLVPMIVPPGLLVIAALLAQRNLVFAPSKLAPKLSRISPVSNAKNKYGRSGLFEFAKSFLKLVIVSSVLALFLSRRMDMIVTTMTSTPGGVSQLMARLATEFLTIIVIVFGSIGGIDLLFQHAEHIRRNRMSHKELKDEMKESEGDPYMKMARRQRAQEIALNSMLADVKEANVIIVNPEHYAVALKWDTTFTGPPICVGKGVDEVAAQIREVAMEAGIPIQRDPPTARAIFAATEIGQEIHPDHYRPVAAAIRFAEEMRAKARKRFID
ncbi:flagellar type III secretion system protein FlhB [Tropicimonas sp. TH_r6]|uniref:EscU/YscU/HrcU family type III secretion system export apparatus switch protein n=1 Tax=Tropicimonas sp. TH_r6 TaxID=3082085 RepID=UPI002953CFB8|nr:flagellar type III secretion system protein FlhB [Tropicimonas sp. TH_r6]MDV7141081.1 flagellar type III secretion system protein FlhB [Tropicimonas sp. TH_r6]